MLDAAHIGPARGFLVTELAVIAFSDGRATLIETTDGVSVDQVLGATEAELVIQERIPQDHRGRVGWHCGCPVREVVEQKNSLFKSSLFKSWRATAPPDSHVEAWPS